MKESWTKLLREIPVTINNLYGDPIIQWENTINKLEKLLESNHTGIISIITKGHIDQNKIKDLEKFKTLKLVFLISISELNDMEGANHENRYAGIKNLKQTGISVISYIRPLIPPYNTTKEKIEKIFQSIHNVGGDIAIVSGFRGDDNMANQVGIDEYINYSLKVKLIPNDLFEILYTLADKYKIKLFTRTACAVSYVTGYQTSYNPYYNSPNLVKCEKLNCPLLDTCKIPDKPKEGSLELARFLGYNVELIESKTKDSQKCSVNGEDRLNCPSCCTTCYKLKDIRHLRVYGDVNLADLAFIRFITGITAMQPDKNDDGSKDIAKVRFPAFSEINNIQCINSWWVIARNTDSCFGCKYCVVSQYYNQNGTNKEIGFAPADLFTRIGGSE